MSQKAYKHIFFDLDRTIWDFDENSKETFRDIYEKYNLSAIFSNYDNFRKTYVRINENLWKLYREGKIEKNLLSYKRFLDTLNEFGVDDIELAKNMAQDYITISPTKKRLFPNAHETLNYLHQNYKLYIITNGFNEVQFTKLKNSDLDKYFCEVITSEDAGAQKPNSQIFEIALERAKAKKEESIMIGDDLEADVLGAKNYGLDQVFFNPKTIEHYENITHEISDLKELQDIL